MKTLIRKYMLVNASMAALFGVTMPVMYLALLDKGLSLIELGTVMAAFTASAMLFEVPCGTLADALGRKRVFLLGEAVLLIATAGFWLASDVGWLMLVMMLTGLSRALLSGSLDALLVKQFQDLSGCSECGPDFLAAQAKIGATSSVCLGLAAILGGFLPIWLAGGLNLSGWVRYYEVGFVVILPLILLHFLLTLWVIKESPQDAGQGRSLLAFSRETAAMTQESSLLILQSPLMLAVMAIQLVSGAALEVVDAFWQPRMAQFIDPRGDSWLFGVLCSISFVAMAAGHKNSVWLSRLFKSQYLMLLLWLQLLMGGAILFLATQERIAGFFVGYAAIFFLSGAMVAPTLTVFHGEAEERLRSTLLSVKAFFLQSGALIAALVLPRIAYGHGIGTAWAIMGVAVLLGSFVYLAPAVRRSAGASRVALATGAVPASSEV